MRSKHQKMQWHDNTTYPDIFSSLVPASWFNNKIWCQDLTNIVLGCKFSLWGRCFGVKRPATIRNPRDKTCSSYFSLQGVCIAVAVMLHYFFTASFTWMCVEAIHMFSKIVSVFNIQTIRMRYYVALGWGTFENK